MGEFVKTGGKWSIRFGNGDSKCEDDFVEDNGIGMTAEEVEEYINQIAFSWPRIWEKVYDKANEDHHYYGLGLGLFHSW